MNQDWITTMFLARDISHAADEIVPTFAGALEGLLAPGDFAASTVTEVTRTLADQQALGRTCTIAACRRAGRCRGKPEDDEPLPCAPQLDPLSVAVLLGLRTGLDLAQRRDAAATVEVRAMLAREASRRDGATQSVRDGDARPHRRRRSPPNRG